MKITDKMRLDALLRFLNSSHSVYSYQGRVWNRKAIDAAIRQERRKKL